MATITELCADLGSGDQIKSYQARQALAAQTGAAGAAGHEADKASLAQALAASLAKVKPAKDGRGEPTPESMIGVAGANEICRALALVGGDAEVAALAACLQNIDLREAARWCLSRMTCQAATDALVEALKNAAGTEFRVGLINALGKKTGSAATETLKTAAQDNEPEVRLAAAEALAETPDASLDAVIAAVETGSAARRQARVAKARIRLGNTLVRAGQKDAARTVFAAVAAADVPAAQKKAAQAALAT
jgi:hypothetical protein